MRDTATNLASRLMILFLGLSGFLLMLPMPGAQGFQLDLLPPPDPDDGYTFRVLCLHDVRDNLGESFSYYPDQFAIETRTLADLFDWIRTNGYNPVSVSQILESRSGGAPLPPRPILLTFDDGYESGYSKVWPLLKKFNYPAVFALVTSWLEVPEDQSIKLSQRLSVPRNTFFSWEQVREMAQSPLIEFASHTHNLHRGVIANPQGNEKAAATTRIWKADEGRYETDAEYTERIRADLAESMRLIELHTGKRPRVIAWPYGMQNRDTDAIAKELGMEIMLTLRPGPNTRDVPLQHVRRALLDYETTAGTLPYALRSPAEDSGVFHPVQRIVQVDLDYVYDPDPAQQERNLSRLIDRIKDLRPSAVYLQAFADEKGTGEITELYFPNRHMPMRADLFDRVAWQLKTRAEVEVYAWMPVLTFSVPPTNPAYGRTVQSAGGPERGPGHPTRLSPFDSIVRQMIEEIYEDLAKSSSFDGILFHDDAILGETEDASPAALKVYESWGLPPDIEKIRRSPELMQRWTEAKTQYLIDFTREIVATVEDYQKGHDMLVVRNLYAQPVLNPEAQAWYAQDLRSFLKAYDYVALMAMPFLEGASDPVQWMSELVHAVADEGGLSRTIFELQTVDWRQPQPLPTDLVARQMQTLRRMGAIHYGYYPEDFVANHPDVEVLRDVMSLQSVLSIRRMPPNQFEARQRIVGNVKDIGNIVVVTE